MVRLESEGTGFAYGTVALHALANAPAEGGRSAGSFASARSTSRAATSGTLAGIGGGASCRWPVITAAGEFRSNGMAPTRHS